MSGATKWIPSGLGYAGPPPLTPTKRLAYKAENKTDGVIIEELLILAGCENIDSPLPELGITLGTLQPVALPVGQAPSSLIKRIDDLTWFDTIEKEDGIITRIPRTITPGADNSRTLTEGVNLANLKRSRNLDGAYANVIVTGISGVGNDGISSYTVEYESDFAIPDANGLTDTYPYSDDLIETAEIAEAWGQTFMGEFGKVQEMYEGELLNGDVTLRAGATISIVSTKFGLGAASRFLVKSVRHVAQNGGAFITYFTARGSANPSGTDANQGPVVLIKVIYDLEYLLGVRTVIAVFDASESYDPDAPEGSLNNGIVTWEWSGDPVEPLPSNNGKQAYAIYTDGAEVGATITLRIGDSHGKHTSKTITLRPNSSKDLFVRHLWAATPDDGVLFSNNGGRSFVSVGVPSAKGVCEVAGTTFNLGWDESGDLWTMTAVMEPGGVTKVLEDKGITAASITIDSDGEETGFAWAGASDGNIYKSDLGGTLGSWVKVTTDATKLPAEVTYVSESPLAAGSLQACSGRGFYISFDGGVTWLVVFQHPNALAKSTHFSGGFVFLTPTEAESKGFISFNGTRTSGQAHFVMERTDDLHPSDFAFPAADLEVDIEAVTLAVDGSELFAVGSDGDNEGGSWAIAPDADGEFERRFWDHARSGKPRHAIRDSRFSMIAYYASELEVGKAFGGFQATSAIRTGEAWKVGIGDLVLLPPVAGAVSFIGQEEGGDGTYFFIQLTNEGWHVGGSIPFPENGPGESYANFRMLRGPDGLTFYAWRVANLILDSPVYSQNVFRSLDNGETWTPLAKVSVRDVSVGGDGTLYILWFDVLGTNLSYIESSPDFGDTWTTLSGRGPVYEGGGLNYGDNLVIDRDDSSIMWVRDGATDEWIGAVKLSTDGGVTFTHDGAVIINEGNSNYFPMISDTEGRVFTGRDPATPNVQVANMDLSLVPSTEDTLGSGDVSLYRYGADDALYHNRGQSNDVDIAGDTFIRKSLDHGATWENLGDNYVISPAGLGYDQENNTFYAPGTSGHIPGEVGDPYANYIFRLVGGEGTWEDISQSMFLQLGTVYDAVNGTVTQ